MKIAKITLTNFRIYKDVNAISFTPFDDKNISIITGKNGFGKTTFLTSLIWSFYGKLMAQVEDKYRVDIKNCGGYEPFLGSIINREVKDEFESGKIKDAVVSVEIELTDLLIPSIPCKKVNIKRSYSLLNQQESLNILIDGIENELTKDVGYDVFINDFILPREIAKFFFFDAEKIVTLAEAKTKEELRSLSKAYSEVLGIKKYEELKKNLETLLTKLRRDGVSGIDKSKMDSLIKKEKELNELIELNNSKLNEVDREISHKRKLSDDIQEKLIREGNAITVEELKVLKHDRDKLKEQSTEIKSKLHKLMDLVPLVLAGKKLVQLKEQLAREQQEQSNVISPDRIKDELDAFAKKVQEKIDLIELNEENRKKVEEALKIALKENQQLSKNQKDNRSILLGFSQEQYLNFKAVFDNINGPFIAQLNAIVQEEKNNRVLLSNVLKQIKHAEARKDNELAKKYREEKASINDDISRLNTSKNSLLEETGALKLRLLILEKDLNKYEKDFKLEETDRKKYLVTEELLNKINKLIARIKEEKKYSLQNSLKLGLTKLMHKNGFVTNVRVNIADDIMDIDLISSNGTVINKDTLSKGEQQLYATALLKALVDESGIEFPVFIDSPLQKFDKHHSRNIIQEFYPTISQQVVLLPLLEKELTMEEFQLLQPNLSKTYVIQNENDNSKIITSDLMKIFNTSDQHVYTN